MSHFLLESFDEAAEELISSKGKHTSSLVEDRFRSSCDTHDGVLMMDYSSQQLGERLLAGTLSLDSRPGRGTIVSIELQVR